MSGVRGQGGERECLLERLHWWWLLKWWELRAWMHRCPECGTRPDRLAAGDWTTVEHYVERILAARLAAPAESELREALGRLADECQYRWDQGYESYNGAHMAERLRAVLGDDGAA